jgi:hypothetical protein
VAHGLEPPDRLAELFAMRGVIDGQRHRPFRSSHDLERERDPPQKCTALASDPGAGVVDGDRGTRQVDVDLVQREPAGKVDWSDHDRVGFGDRGALTGPINEEHAVHDAAHGHEHRATASRCSRHRGDDHPGLQADGLEVRLGEESAEGRRARQFTTLGPEDREGRCPEVGLIEVRQQVPPAERVECADTAARAHRPCGDGQVLVSGDVKGCHRHGRRRICLAIVSSCICCEPP